MVSASNVNSSTDRDSPLEIRFNKGQYAQNPSTITLGGQYAGQYGSYVDG